MSRQQFDSFELSVDLTDTQRLQIWDLFQNYADIFTWDTDGMTDLGVYKGPFLDGDDGVRLHVKDHPPIFQKPYKMSLFN